MTQPLEGVKVLDLSRVLAGPLCTMLLADLGADVIKIERPGRGDETREWGPPFDSAGVSAYFLSTNRNKLGVAADLRSLADQKMIDSLADEADVVIENFLPGVLRRTGIDLGAALKRNQRLIWCTITGFGEESRRPGYDFVVQAEAGWMAITGSPDGEPMKVGVALADVVAGKDATIAILSALVGRSRGNSSERRIVISLIDSARAALVNVAHNALVSNADARRWGNAHANLVPYQLFETRDRPIVIAVGSDDQWQACLRALELGELAADRELATNRGRLAHRDRVIQVFERVLRTRTAPEWLARLEAERVPSGVVKSVLEALADVGHMSPITGLPSSVGGRVRLPPPKLDEHGDAVRAFGWQAFQRLASL